jgi:hypothetical protein
MKVEARTRVVFVLGRTTSLDRRDIAASADSASEVVLLSVGYPLTPAQQRAVDAALALAPHVDVVVDVHLVTTPRDLAGLIGDGSRVVVTGTAREQRQLRRSLRRS